MISDLGSIPGNACVDGGQNVMAFGHLFNFCLYNRQNSLFISWLKMSAFSQRKSFAVTSSFSSKNVDSMQLFFQIFCIRLHSKGDALRKTTVAIKKIFIRSFNIFLFEIIFVSSYCVGGCYVICSIQIKTKVYKFNFVCMFPISYQCKFFRLLTSNCLPYSHQNRNLWENKFYQEVQLSSQSF